MVDFISLNHCWFKQPPPLLQGAYLVGVSDPNSHAGQKGLVDPSQFAKAKQSIQMACQNLVDPACTQSQVPFSINVPQLDWIALIKLFIDTVHCMTFRLKLQIMSH